MRKRLTLLFSTALLAGLPAAASASAEPLVKSSPATVDFGEVDNHFGGSPRQSVQLSNTSGAEVQLGSAAIVGPDASAFRLVNDGCSNGTLAVLGSCSVEVELPAGATGPRSATLELAAGGGAVEVPLSATGVTGVLSASPGGLSFSAIPYTHGAGQEGEQNETEQVNVTDSTAGTQLESVAIVGADSSSFSIQYGNCQGDLMAANNTCSVGVRFQPPSPGVKHATLLITGDAASGTLEVPLEGEGRNGPHLSASTTQALLGGVALGGSLAQTFTVTNTGDYPLFIQQLFLISGTPLMFPVTTNTCSGVIVAPGEACAVTVDFEPTTTGQKDASLLVISNATPSILVLGIDGAGTEAPEDHMAPPSNVAGGPGVPSGVAAASSLRLTSGLRPFEVVQHATVNSGFVAACPARSAGCRAVSVITAAAAHAARTSARGVLGSAVTLLSAGGRRLLRVHLSRRGLRLLKGRAALSVEVSVVVRSGTTVLAHAQRGLVLVGRRAPRLPARPHAHERVGSGTVR